MFGPVGFNEILLILVVALIIFGPKRLPQIGRTVGRALGEFRRATSDLKRTMQSEMASLDEEVAAKPSAAERIAPAAGAVERRSEPARPEPVAQEPVAQEPVAQEPVAQEPVATDPAPDPVADAPSGSDPAETP